MIDHRNEQTHLADHAGLWSIVDLAGEALDLDKNIFESSFEKLVEEGVRNEVLFSKNDISETNFENLVEEGVRNETPKIIFLKPILKTW